jgi:hypothetical protein
MKTVVSIAFALSAIAAPIGAAHAGDSPEVIYDKQIKLVEAMASIIQDNTTNCHLMGDKLGKLMDDNAALLRDAQKLTPEQKKQGEPAAGPPTRR